MDAVLAINCTCTDSPPRYGAALEPLQHELSCAFRLANTRQHSGSSLFRWIDHFRYPADLTIATLEQLLQEWVVTKRADMPTVLEVGPMDEEVARHITEVPARPSWDSDVNVLAPVFRVVVNPGFGRDDWGLR